MTQPRPNTAVDHPESTFAVPGHADDLDLDVYAFRVYAAICRNVARYGAHVESVPRMAARVGMSERRARQALRTLEAAGLIDSRTEPGCETDYRLARVQS